VGISRADTPAVAACGGRWRRRAGAITRLGGAAASLCLLGACASLLPSARTEVVSTWSSYEVALQSLAAITPYQADRLAVHRQGLDPRHHPGVSVLHYADVLKRFAAAASLPPEHLDRGIRDCLHAGQRCTGYAVSVTKKHSKRVGNFWLDMLSFRRETVITGWSVDALLVFVDDQLVYELVGGQPTVQVLELQRNPLGPLQTLGERALSLKP